MTRTVHTTLGELIEALVAESEKSTHDEDLAVLIASTTLNELLSRARPEEAEAEAA